MTSAATTRSWVAAPPIFAFANGTKLGEVLKSGKGVLLDLAPDASLRTIATWWADRLIYAASAVEDSLGLAAVLVRPDGVDAWIAEQSTDDPEVAGTPP